MVAIMITAMTRLALVMLFLPFSALDKILNFGAARGQAAQAGLTGWVTAAMVLSGLTLEATMSLGVLTGLADRACALVLAVYCVITAVLWKRFWATPDFRLKGPSQGREVFWDFFKNIAVAGGFLTLAFGPNASHVADFFAAPLASSNPYQIEAAQ